MRPTLSLILASLMLPCLLCGCGQEAPVPVAAAPAPPSRSAIPTPLGFPKSVAPASQKTPSVPDGKPPAWLVKMDPEAVTAQATLDKRLPLERRRQIFIDMKRQQDAERVRIHAHYAQLPPESSPEEGMRRSADEGQRIVSAQDKVFDEMQRRNHLSNDQMDALTQESQDHHWEVN